ncbi:binding partner of ACD11 1 isoform X2 [Rhodamnia argentea]|uniref:Binding partner of ACD11 1 isoform X2 n=1 Tax=Rhodamnia argentea TaxID=178133 RepID=A0A8B8PHF2_9MYRT|nr:binding partner of ACD11 1 isoform X2 [Rhodamnia argentea]
MAIRTVKVNNLSLTASELNIREFFSFSGEIDCVEMHSDHERSQIAYVTFKNPNGAETAALLSGATIVDRPVTIALAPDYKQSDDASTLPTGTENNGAAAGSPFQKAEEVVSSMLAKGFVLGKDVLNRAKSFDEKHHVTATATATVASLDRKIGLSGKFGAGTAVVNEKMKEMDQKFQVSEKTKSAIATAEQTASTAGSAIMKNRYALSGASWVAGAYGRVTKAAGEVGQKTQEKVAAEEESQGRKT